MTKKTWKYTKALYVKIIKPLRISPQIRLQNKISSGIFQTLNRFIREADFQYTHNIWFENILVKNKVILPLLDIELFDLFPKTGYI